MFKEGIMPLDDNKYGIEHFQAVEKSHLGGSPEAKAEQLKWGSMLTEAQAKGGDAYEQAMKKFAGQIVNQNIEYMLYTESIATAMFDVITVRGTDIPAYSLETTPEIDIVHMSAHGYPPSVSKFMSETQYFPTFYRISTPRIYQDRQSILTGNVGPNALINQRARYEMEQQIEDDIWTLLTATLGTFTTPWVYDNRIQGLPTSNQLDLSSHGALTKAFFQDLLAATNKIPSRRRRGQPARIRNMFVPFTAVESMRQWVSVVSSVAAVTGSQDANETISPALQERMESNGVLLPTMWGESLGMRKVNRLMGTTSANWEKYIWIFMDEPIGRLILKPDEDWQDRLTDRIPIQEGFVMSKNIALEIPIPYAPNFMQVQYAP